LFPARLAAERFVVAEGSEDDVGLRLRQPIIGQAEPGGAKPEREFIAGEAEVAERQIVLRKAKGDQGLQPTVVLHALGKRVADDGNVVAVFEFERSGLAKGG